MNNNWLTLNGLHQRHGVRLLLPVAITVFLGACAVGNDYKRPDQVLPAVTVASKTLPAELQQWWLQFHDDALTESIAAALAHNTDLRQALARFDQASALLGLARAEYFPAVNASASDTRMRTSSAIEQQSGTALTTTTYRAGIGISYELDVWGRVRRQAEAAQAELNASDLTREAAAAALAAQVAQTLFEQQALLQQIVLTQQELGARQEQQRVLQKRFDAGAISGYDLYQAQSETSRLNADLPRLQTALQQTTTALAILRGDTPSQMAQSVLQTSHVLIELPAAPEIPAGLTSDLLQRRPDVRAAEQQLIAANARIGVAKAGWFPVISLTGFLGSASKLLSDLLTPEARTWSAAATITEPLSGIRAVGQQIDLADARYREQLAVYEHTVQTAFKESLDALQNHSSTQLVMQAQSERLRALREAERIAKARYEAGQIAYLDYLDVLRQLQALQQEQIAAQRDYLNATVDVMRALGGGWDSNSRGS